MTTYLKIMCDSTGKPDSDAWASYELHIIPEGSSVSFTPSPVDAETRYEARIMGFDPEFNRVIPLWGNAYVMSESGKTIASHGC